MMNRTDFLRPCAFCSDMIKPVKRFNSQMLFCSDSCRQMAYRKRKKGALASPAPFASQTKPAISPASLEQFIHAIGAQSYTIIADYYHFRFDSKDKAELLLKRAYQFLPNSYLQPLYPYKQVSADSFSISIHIHLLDEQQLQYIIKLYGFLPLYEFEQEKSNPYVISLKQSL